MWISIKVPQGLFSASERELISSTVDNMAQEHLMARMRKIGVPVREIHLMETQRPHGNENIYITYMNAIRLDDEANVAFISAFLQDCVNTVSRALKQRYSVVASTTNDQGPRYELLARRIKTA